MIQSLCKIHRVVICTFCVFLLCFLWFVILYYGLCVIAVSCAVCVCVCVCVCVYIYIYMCVCVCV